MQSLKLSCVAAGPFPHCHLHTAGVHGSGVQSGVGCMLWILCSIQADGLWVQLHYPAFSLPLDQRAFCSLYALLLEMPVVQTCK